MNHTAHCPECGAPRADAHQDRGNVAVEPIARELTFSRVLNGTQWREKPNSPPRYRDDVVPND